MRAQLVVSLGCSLLLVLAWTPARADGGDPAGPAAPEPPPALVTERPGATESSQAAPHGCALFEFGLDYRAGEHTQEVGVPLLLVRYGLGGGGEVRVGFTGLELSFPDEGPGEATIGPLLLGGKYALELAEGFDVSLSGVLGLPLRGEAYSSAGIGLTFKLGAALAVADRVSLGANFGVDVLGLGAGSSAQERVYLASLLLGFEATERTFLFLEGYGQIPEQARDDARAVLQAGFAFQPAPHWQVDGFLGMDLRHAPRAVVAGVGGAVLW